MIDLNAVEHIEGEHILTIPDKLPSPIELNPITSSTSISGKNEYSVKVQDGEEGDVIFSAVNAPWKMR